MWHAHKVPRFHMEAARVLPKRHRKFRPRFESVQKLRLKLWGSTPTLCVWVVIHKAGFFEPGSARRLVIAVQRERIQKLGRTKHFPRGQRLTPVRMESPSTGAVATHCNTRHISDGIESARSPFKRHIKSTSAKLALAKGQIRGETHMDDKLKRIRLSRKRQVGNLIKSVRPQQMDGCSSVEIRVPRSNPSTFGNHPSRPRQDHRTAATGPNYRSRKGRLSSAWDRHPCPILVLSFPKNEAARNNPRNRE